MTAGMISKLDRELRQLESMTRAELVDRWQAAYDCPPPQGARVELLTYAAGWQIQVHHRGGLPKTTAKALRREIDRIKRETSAVRSAVSDPVSAGSAEAALDPLHVSGLEPASVPRKVTRERRKPLPGAHLLRDWNGRTHAVDVTEKGFLYKGTIHRSLSAIAREITGAHWSGPRFFGL